MRTRTTIILTFFILITQFAIAQDFPIVIKPGETKSITSTTEALYVLLKSDMKVMQDTANELAFARKKISLLTTENSLQLEKEQIYLRDTTIYSNLYHHYYSLWDSTDHQLEATEIKLARVQHNKWNLGLTGMLIGVIATILIVK